MRWALSYNNTKKLMFTMLGDGQLLKDGKGRYYPANPTKPGNPGNPGNLGNSSDPGNPSGNSNNLAFLDTYGKNGSRVTEVTEVGGDGDVPAKNRPSGRRLTAEEAEEVKRLVDEGMSAKAARDEVTRADPRER